MWLRLLFPRMRLSLASTTMNIFTNTTNTNSITTNSSISSSTRWVQTMSTGDKDKPSFTHMTEEEAQLLAQLSEALLQDEANALAVSLPENNSVDSNSNNSNNNNNNNNNSEGESWMTQLSSQDYMELAMNPIIPQRETPELQDGGNNNNKEKENNNNNNNGSNVLASSVEESSLSRAMRDVLQSSRSDEMSAALAGAVCAFLTTPATLVNRAASELLLSGTDVKALLSDGTLRGLCMEEKCLSQCDFSTVSFLSVSARSVDFSRSVFYAAVFHDSVFVNCSFDGCVMKELRCSGHVRFEGCSFRFAHIVLRGSSLSSPATAGKKREKRSGVLFDRCEFDLCDFDGSDAIPQSCFVDCVNTDLASKFPPRVNGC
ncbi:uncharacterized protein TM35_000212250 [Trypanosoma theileri]|uniref:Uncharacterized protein n=1 Tax=Trypanosoma theileri TaxID=67003 RepID=A0A1X0NTW5_9TRYP|nr:uncharacterized protein TM35_000212250 [Trypanosoma theileri]ORC87619.1 hypothetical protein TM35_000212250 [Trypanosoma theileri]